MTAYTHYVKTCLAKQNSGPKERLSESDRRIQEKRIVMSKKAYNCSKSDRGAHLTSEFYKSVQYVIVIPHRHLSQNFHVAAVAEWYRYRTVACLVTCSSPVSLKTGRVGQRCTLNLSRAEMSSRWCGVVVRRGGASSGVVHVT
ncbi:uncharacterized protein TNCV_1002771 [Trichonephila clavipes]|nr:uncharacterized protein TNCV_1002771 [Trichonephila clavipes]